MPRERLITPELARYITELSRDTGRQIGVLIDRKGQVALVVIGTDREIVIPQLKDHPLGRRPLRGLRLVHTHLKNEPLTQDDLTDLALLRLDFIAAIGVGPDGLPEDLHAAHIVPYNAEGRVYEVWPPSPFHGFDMDMEGFILDLEARLGRAAGRDVRDSRERAMLVSVSTGPRDEQMESLAELVELARTSSLEVVGTVCQRPHKINPKHLIGSGKIRELIISALQKEATLIIFDQDLTASQAREIAEVTELKVIDRTQLILDIFAGRAHSRDGKVQVELAQLKYLLPKLTGKGTEMSRLMGGIGGRGPGETKLETDRRRVADRISRLEKELEVLSKARYERRRRRRASGIPVVSIVGYTNAGKSTLLNALTRSETLVEDKLFATLDTATRRLRFPMEREAVITDTVGFIRDLPEELVKAFRATLEEMEDADLLLHVVDVSSPVFEKHMDTVERILRDIGLGHIERLLVLNKADLVDPVLAQTLSRRYNGVAVSAINAESLVRLTQAVEQRLWPS